MAFCAISRVGVAFAPGRADCEPALSARLHDAAQLASTYSAYDLRILFTLGSATARQ
jgi:hypothetical protein